MKLDLSRKASDRQIALLKELAVERELSPEAHDRLITKLLAHEDPGESYEMPFSEADAAISWFFRPGNAPVRPGIVPSHIQAMPKVPAKSLELAAEDKLSQHRRDPKTLPTSGVFRRDSETYIVVTSRRNPERHYAMRMIETPDRLTASGEVVNFDYVRDPGAIWLLYDEHRLPAEAVEALMIQHSVCIYPGCGRRLKAAKSVARGAGKEHAKRLGLI